MKRIGNVYPTMQSVSNCERAIHKASEHKRNRVEVKEVLDDLKRRAKALPALIENYTPSPYREIIRADGLKRKQRRILVPKFWPDQCVPHAVIDPLVPYLVRRMYYWSCGSIKGRGVKHAQRGIERATMRDPKHAKYCLQMDIKHCYENIRNEPLIATLHKFIKDKRALAVLERIVKSNETLPIGNYSSPWFCNLYLTPLDRFITEQIKPAHYVRYADDFVLLDSNKRKLTKAEKLIREFTEKHLFLSLHDNACVFKVRRAGENPKSNNRPVDFVGMRFCIGYTVLRKQNALALMRQSRKIQKALIEGKPINYKTASGFISRSAQLKHCRSHGLRVKYVDPIDIKILKGVIKGESKRQQRARSVVCRAEASPAAGQSHCNPA